RRSGRRVHRGPSGPHCVGYGRSRARGFRARLRSRYCLPSGQVVSLLCGGGFGGLFAFGGRGSGFLVLGAKVLDLRLVNGGDDGVCLDEQRGTGGQDQVGGEDVVAHFAAVDVHGDLLGQVGRVGLQRNGVVVDLEDGARGNLALDVHGHVDGDLLALLHGQQVEVVDRLAQCVALDVLDQGEVGLALDVDGQQGVGRTDGQGGLLGWQQDVQRLGAVAVDDGRDLEFAAGGAGSALAEVGADL